MRPILEIQNISKRFRIRHQESYLSLRETISHFFESSTVTEDFLALSDVNFSVNPGESIGIIGRNGAGKSTLLKILSKITPPSEGRVICRGRIASLLEVGTGFHPELTGRENIFLNGSILGMKKREIEKCFDEIVDFAGTEKFLDTPLKHYSSGMQLRLAFAVAAFLEPEILLVDEVLAVGDSEFQRKCIGKMEDVNKHGRTILFVSHNMAAVESFCTRTILLNQGKILAQGPSGEVISQYANLSLAGNSQAAGVMIAGSADSNKPIKKIEMFCDDKLSDAMYMGCKMEIRVHFSSVQPLESPVLGLIVKDYYNMPLLGINNKHYMEGIIRKPVCTGYIAMVIPYLTLFEGVYDLDIHFGNAFKDIEVWRDCRRFIVEPMGFTKSGELPDKKLNRFFIQDVEWGLASLDSIK